MDQNVLQKLRHFIRRGEDARQELPLTKEFLEAEQELILRSICVLVDKGVPTETLWVAVCELRAVRRLARQLVGALESGEMARQQAQEEIQGPMGPQGG